MGIQRHFHRLGRKGKNKEKKNHLQAVVWAQLSSLTSCRDGFCQSGFCCFLFFFNFSSTDRVAFFPAVKNVAEAVQLFCEVGMGAIDI